MLRIDKSHAKTLSIFDPRLSWQDGVSSKTYLDPLFPVVEPSSYSIFHNISYLTSHVSLFVFLHNIYKPFHSHDLIGNYLDFFSFSLVLSSFLSFFHARDKTKNISLFLLRSSKFTFFLIPFKNMPLSTLLILAACRTRVISKLRKGPSSP